MSRVIAFLLACFLPAAFCAADGPTFDVASVKIAGPETQQPYNVTGGPGTSDPGRFHGPHMAMTAMLTKAFGVSSDQIQGPKWLRDFRAQTYYNIDATMPPDTTKEQFQQMFQNLLIERFHLVVRHETRNFPGYALVIDSGGPKLKEVTPDPNPDAPQPGAPVTSPFAQRARGDDGFPVVRGPFTMGQISSSGKTRTKYQERSMAEFVSNLGFLIGSSQGKPVTDGYLQPRVVDKTGLTGKYTFILEYSNATGASLVSAFASQAGPAGPAARGGADESAPAASDPSGAADILTAIRKQLGLRLDKTADVPLDVIVVEGVDKTPIEN